MNNRRWVLVLIGIIIALVAIMIGNNHSMSVYSISVANNDLDIRDLQLIVSGDEIYVPDIGTIAWPVEKTEVTEVMITLQYGDARLIDAFLNFNHERSITIPGSITVRKMTIEKNAVLDLTIKYKVNGLHKDFQRMIRLKDYLVKN